MRRRLLAASLILLAVPAAAEEVTSARPDRVTATLYQSTLGLPDVALISETRSIELPAGDSVIHFEGVASTLIPQTARVEGLPTSPRHADFDYALFDAATVLDKSVGAPAEFIQSPPKAPETRRVGRLVSQQGIVAFEDENGVETFGCGGPPARLVVGTPPGLRSKPALSVSVRTDRPGRHSVRLSYLAERIRWRAVYVARFARDGRSLDLEGRIVVENGSATGFDRVPTRFVVGNLPRLSETRAPWIAAARPQRDCWGKGRTSDPVLDERRAMIIPGSEQRFMSAAGTVAPPAAAKPAGRDVEQEALGDLKMFRLEEPVRIAALQQKLFTFMSAARVKAEPFFIVPVAASQSVVGAARQAWRVNNTKAAGLGKPLPHGTATLYGAGNTFLGADAIPVGVPEGRGFDLRGSASGDVNFEHAVTAERKDGNSHRRTRVVVLTNTTGRAAVVEMHLPQAQTRSVMSVPGGVNARDGNWMWRTRLGPHETRRLTFTTLDLY